MPGTRRILATLVAGIFLCALAAHGQDSPDSTPSLGDAARQARLQKQQKDAAANKDAAAQLAPGKDAQNKDATSKDAQPKDAKPKTPDAESGKESHHQRRDSRTHRADA